MVLMTVVAQSCGSDVFEPRPRGKEDRLLNQISDGMMIALRVRETLVKDKIDRAKSACKSLFESSDQLSFEGKSLLQINEELTQSCDCLQVRVCSDFDRGMFDLRNAIQKDWFKE